MHAVNLEAVTKSGHPAVIRALAQYFIDHPILDVGTFLRELRQVDLDELIRYCNVVVLGKDYDEAFSSLILLAEMVAQAESGALDAPDPNRSSNLMILLTFEGLARKGVIEFDREKATLFADLQELNIARLKGPQ